MQEDSVLALHVLAELKNYWKLSAKYAKERKQFDEPISHF